MVIKAVFFDLDDTLCLTSGSRQARARLAHETLTRAGHAVDFDALLESVLRVEPEQTYIRGLQPALRELGLLDTEAGRTALGIWFFEGAEHLIEGFAGCLDALQALSTRYRLGVITNGPEAIQARKFEALKVGAHFAPDLFVTSERASCFKPDERIFRCALELADVEAHEAIHIGDSLEADVAGALGAGMRAVWFNPNGGDPEGRIVPDATISSYAELPALIEKWSG